MTIDLELAAKDRGIKYYLVSFTNLYGGQRSKLVRYPTCLERAQAQSRAVFAPRRAPERLGDTSLPLSPIACGSAAPRRSSRSM